MAVRGGCSSLMMGWRSAAAAGMIPDGTDGQSQNRNPQRTRLKICGLRRPEQAAAVAALGADAIGVIGVSGSARFVAAGERPALFAAARRQRADCRGVLVVADPSDSELADLAGARGHQVLQLHGEESVERCGSLRERLDVEIWKAIRVRSAADLGRALAYAPAVDGLLLDAWVADQLGGTGHRIPMEWLQGFDPPLPWWLAGGITPQRVAEVLSQLRPSGLDASSGVEISPGEKDLQRVESLVAAVRQWGGGGG